MTLNVVIADDEYFIRKRIAKLIPWEDMGLTLVGEAENGEEVLALLTSYSVDLLILDIKMPKMSGIEVANFVKKYTPQTHMIILSGYDDFKYVQSALRAGSKEYLLKPVQQEDLLEAIRSCIHSIELHSDIHQRLQLFEQYEWAHQLSCVRDSSRSYDELCELYPEYGVFHYSVYCTLYAEESPFEKAHELSTQLINANFSCVHSQESENICILQIFVPEKECFQHIGSIFTNFIQNQEKFVYLYLDEIFPTHSNWAPYYQRSLHLITERYFSSSSDLCIRYSHHAVPVFQEEVLQLRKDLIAVLHGNEEIALRQYIHQVFLSVKEKKSCDFLCMIVTEIFTIYHLYFHVPEQITQSIADFAASILASEHSLDVLESEIVFYGLECIHKIETVPSDVAICRKITEYIDEHFRESTLSVSEIADTLGMTASYLGSVFKKVYHSSILQYLSDRRIDTAKTLLKQGDLKIAEIAEASGFSDVYYFSKKFKKACGCSPTTYAGRKNF